MSFFHFFFFFFWCYYLLSILSVVHLYWLHVRLLHCTLNISRSISRIILTYADSEAGTWSLWSACSVYRVQERRQQCTSCEAGFRLQERFCDPSQQRMYLLTYYYTVPQRGAKYCDEYHCLSVSSHNSKTTRPNYQFFVHVFGSVLL